MATRIGIVEQGQCLLDVACSLCGDATAFMEIALLNNISPTDDLTPGTQLILPDAYDAAVVDYFKSNGFVPATSETNEQAQTVLEGIGYWIIGIDFKVT